MFLNQMTMKIGISSWTSFKVNVNCTNFLRLESPSVCKTKSICSSIWNCLRRSASSSSSTSKESQRNQNRQSQKDEIHRIKRQHRKPEDIDAFGAWDSAVQQPLIMDASIAKGIIIPKILKASVGVSSVRGRRPTQEDNFGVEQLGPKGNILYLGIFDGHGGSTCSRFCKRQMPKHINFWLEANSKSELDFTSILQYTFIEVNNAYSRWFTFNRKSNEMVSPGSTATVVLIGDNGICAVANVGDSRAILCRDGEARKLTIDHTPNLLTEKRRIENAGGKVTRTSVTEDDLITRRLAMTRSIGDLEFKRLGVIAEPSIRIIELAHNRDAFLVLTSDGINNVMTDKEIIESVKQASEPQEAANLLTEIAIAYSSSDNSTALVAPLGCWGNATASGSIFHSFGKSFTSSSRFG